MGLIKAGGVVSFRPALPPIHPVGGTWFGTRYIMSRMAERIGVIRGGIVGLAVGRGGDELRRQPGPRREATRRSLASNRKLPRRLRTLIVFCATMFARRRSIKSKRSLLVAATFGCLASLLLCGGISSPANSQTRSSTLPLSVTWMRGYAAPGTPGKYNKVGVIKVGPSGAKNVLVLEPGASAAAAYFVPTREVGRLEGQVAGRCGLSSDGRTCLRTSRS